ncbi:MAG: hypothetical protein LBQ62_08155 [Candidatus Accumulibacter sp.]|nr:hypothetical protein [Accumulibacter sp.]
MTGSLECFGNFLRERQRWVLLGLLAVLHLTLMVGGTSPIGLTCWFVDVGLFILWQPFIQTGRQLDYGKLPLVLAALAMGAWLFGWWLLIVWVIVLASLLGGRVIVANHRPTRIFYLLAFAYLLGAMLIWLVPKIVPDPALLGLSLEAPFVRGAPLLFLGMALMPKPREPEPSRSGRFDFHYGVFIFLLMSVLVLGCLAFMLLGKRLYFEALFRTVISMAVLLLVVAWAWNPRPGFGGVGAFFSRYLLTVGLPFDVWLQQLVDCAEREDDPDRFMQDVCERLLSDLPWVSGGRWSPVAGADAGAGCFGEQSAHAREFLYRPLRLTVYTRHALSPVLAWHLQLLSRVACEYYLAKRRAAALQRMNYLRAVHETGARVTHEVKNMLQSLDGLCYLVETSDAGDTENLQRLIRRQLPQIGLRLRQTLAKLQPPSPESAKRSAREDEAAATDWWEGLRQRFSHPRIHYVPVRFDPGARLPAELFDSVADNLLHNALTKLQNESALRIDVSLARDANRLRVRDNGSALEAALAARLFRAPVASESGFGIGLLNAASQAEARGYSLRLAENDEGRVCFELARKETFGPQSEKTPRNH